MGTSSGSGHRGSFTPSRVRSDPNPIGPPWPYWECDHYDVYANGKYYTVGANPRSASACGLAGGRSYNMQVILAYDNHQEIAARSQVVTAVLR